MGVAFRRLLPVLLLGVLPAAVLISAGCIYGAKGTIGMDFRGELYPEGHLLLHGLNPFTGPSMDTRSGPNRIFPVPVALLISPVSLLGPYAAAAVFAIALLGCLGLTLWLLGVTDWRVYGAVAMWPSSIAAIQTGNVSILVVLCIAVAVRLQAHRILPGVAIGAAISVKLFPWPLIVWLLAKRRYAAALAATAIAVATVLSVLPFISLSSYARLLKNLGDTFGPDSYNLLGLLSQLGVSNVNIAQGCAYAAGFAVLALAWHRRSLPLTIAACLMLSPIVWTHFLVILAVPLASRWSRFSAAWLIPLALIVCPGGGSGAVWETLVGLIVIAAVTFVTEWPRDLSRVDLGSRTSPAQGFEPAR